MDQTAIEQQNDLNMKMNAIDVVLKSGVIATGSSADNLVDASKKVYDWLKESTQKSNILTRI